MTLVDIWLIEALVFMFGGAIIIGIVAWFVDQFNNR
jgi:hypothetical protein